MRRKNFCRLISLLLCLLLLVGCTKPENKPDPAKRDPKPTDKTETLSVSEQFDAFTDELFKSEIVLNTINLHYTLAHPENYGIKEYEPTLGTFQYEEMQETYSALEELKTELLSYDTKQLTKEQNLTYDIIMDYVEAELSTSDLLLYTEILGPTTGYQAQLPVLLAEYGFRTKQDIEDYLTLVSQVDELFADIAAFEEKKAEAGLFMSDYAADAIIDQCKEFIASPEDNYMIEIFNDEMEAFEGLTEKERNDYIERNRTLITTEVVKGYQTLIDGLTACKGKGTNELGLCYYENGKRYYEYLVRTATGSDRTVPELQKMTENFILKALNNMYVIMTVHPEAYEAMMDYSYCETEPEVILEDLLAKISNDFPKAPDANYKVKVVHPSMQEHMSPAFYLTPPIDDIQNNVIYINPKYVDEEIYTTIAHEGYPGHLYQTVYTSSKNLPLVRSLFGYSGYTEGWATYVEYEYSYGYALDGADINLANLLKLNMAAIMGLYAQIDMGIHYDGWDLAKVEQYLEDFGVGDKEAAREIFETMVEEPSNYLSYFIGYLEFLNLREIAQKELGDKFSAKEFHDFLLTTGPAPFYIIEKYMNDWMQEQKTTK